MYDEAKMGKQPSENEQVSNEIDSKIRGLYEDTVKEGVPDRFAKLLDDLRKKETNK